MLRVVQIGLGPLGQKVVRYALERPGIRIVAAVDPAPDKAGRDVGDVCGLKPLGVQVHKTLESALKGKSADVAILTTVSGFQRIAGQIEEIARFGLPIVSTCEELSFPLRKQPKLAERLDRICRKHKIACLGTGVNPGFLMDYLPSVLTSVCQKVDSVRVIRFQDASSRRVPFQQKIGAGLTRRQFNAKVAEGTLRHVGLVESMQMIAQGLNWKLDRVTESLKPVIARHKITGGYMPIDKGIACGVEQIGRAYRGGKEVIRLHFRAAVGEPESFDSIEIAGTPSFRSTIAGGVNGDIATCAITINALRCIRHVAPGLKTMLDVPVPACFAAI